MITDGTINDLFSEQVALYLTKIFSHSPEGVDMGTEESALNRRDLAPSLFLITNICLFVCFFFFFLLFQIIREWHRPRIAKLLEAGVDFLAVETIPSLVS